MEFAPSSGGLGSCLRHRDGPANDDDDSVACAPFVADCKTIVLLADVQTIRMPWAPGRSGTQPVPRLVLVVDVRALSTPIWRSGRHGRSRRWR